MEPRVPRSKVAEAQALWEIAMLYIAMGAAARTISGGTSAAGPAAAGGYRASQLLARAYYRLLRAIWTGFTLADRGDTAGESTSLRELYSDFETLAYRSIPRSKHADVRRRVRVAGSNREDALGDLAEEWATDLESDEDRYPDDPDLIQAGEQVTPQDGDDYASDLTDDRDWSDEQDILIEELEEAERHLREVEEAEREELRKLEEELERIDREQRKMEAKAKQAARRRAAKDRGKRAGAAMKAAQSGGRAEIVALTTADSRALAFVSIPRGIRPCYWCVMLASRGLMSYKNRPRPASATGQWHNNCKCAIEPIFDREDYFTNDLFARNRAAYNMWRDFKKSGGGRTDPATWRSHFDTAYRAGKRFDDLLQADAAKHRSN